MRPEHFLIVISFLSVLQPSQLHKTFLEQPAPKLDTRRSAGRRWLFLGWVWWYLLLGWSQGKKLFAV